MHPVFLAAQSSQEIDTLGIGFCNAEVLRLAVSSAVSWLSSQAVPNAIWVDGNLKFDCPAAWPVEWVIKGDQLSYAIACASVVAKQVRDYWMIRAASRFSGYGFEDHKGYATQKHLRAIREHGLSPIHRRSFCQTLLHPQTTWLGDR
jgi:ribonuclease HII